MTPAQRLAKLEAVLRDRGIDPDSMVAVGALPRSEGTVWVKGQVQAGGVPVVVLGWNTTTITLPIEAAITVGMHIVHEASAAGVHADLLHHLIDGRGMSRTEATRFMAGLLHDQDPGSPVM